MNETIQVILGAVSAFCMVGGFWLVRHVVLEAAKRRGR